MNDVTAPSAPASGLPPTPAPAPAPASPPSPPAGRPEWVPETAWDATANTVNLDGLKDAVTGWQTHQQRTAELAARKPEDITFDVPKLPDTIKVPDGFQLKIDDKDPRIPMIRDIAIKRGWDQETVNDLVALDAQLKIQDHAAEQARVAEETKKLGTNAPQRIAAVTNWLTGLKTKGDLSAEEHAAMVAVATDAAAVSAMEKLIAKAAGTIPGNTGDPPAPPPAQTTVEQRWYGQKG